ncbi:MAG: 16S rRNA (adenine(1518)-N(6)/adenine(1519)-N(6))-dimethyltransferase RsmA [Peptococcaceae bacterium]|nr:16S rRNA (adenine(1518)-N(6)/adenine(1519)-N(6))-dimethyltransferase RsmA [Peptococcaceae bacterium]
MPEITSPAAVRAVMERYGISCRKSLGQNFLIDQNIVKKIVAAADLTSEDLVVEIGPGLGALTGQAARSAGRVLAVELDRGLMPALAEILAGAGNVEVMQGDALEIDFDRVVAEKTGGAYGPGGKKYKLLANLPYCITSPLLMHLLLGRYNISLMVVMVQLEVAARLAAAPGTREYGALSVAVQYFTEPKTLFRVPGTVFFPPPGVDSAVVRLLIRPAPAVAVEDEEIFFKVVRSAFGRRRKTLLNALAGSGLGPGRETWLSILDRAGIDPGRRGETLTLAEFASIANAFISFAT